MNPLRKSTVAPHRMQRSRSRRTPRVIYLRSGDRPAPRANIGGLLRALAYAAIPAFVAWVLVAIAWRLVRGG